jgi:hypothetical protein
LRKQSHSQLPEACFSFVGSIKLYVVVVVWDAGLLMNLGTCSGVPNWRQTGLLQPAGFLPRLPGLALWPKLPGPETKETHNKVRGVRPSSASFGRKATQAVSASSGLGLSHCKGFIPAWGWGKTALPAGISEYNWGLVKERDVQSGHRTPHSEDPSTIAH